MGPDQYSDIAPFRIFILALRHRDGAQIFSRVRGLLVVSFLPARCALFAMQHFHCIAAIPRLMLHAGAVGSPCRLRLALASLGNPRRDPHLTRMKCSRAELLRKARTPCA